MSLAKMKQCASSIVTIQIAARVIFLKPKIVFSLKFLRTLKKIHTKIQGYFLLRFLSKWYSTLRNILKRCKGGTHFLTLVFDM